MTTWRGYCASTLLVILLTSLSACGSDGGGEKPENNGNNGSGDDTGVTRGTDAGTTDTNVEQDTWEPPPPAIDLRADTNRNGTLDFDDPTEDEGEDDWTAERGAIFLANLDDDDESCSLTGPDRQLAECFDANDNSVDGPTDLADMARLATAPMPEAGENATATITVEGAEHIRLFKKVGESWEFFDHANETLKTQDVLGGVEFALEGRDVIRDETWDGFVDITIDVSSDVLSEDAITTDTVRMRVAPLILRHHLDPAEEVYVSERGVGGDLRFTDDVKDAVKAANVDNPLVEIDVEDQWTQDYFETAYMAMPSTDGLHVIHVYIRSANVYYDWRNDERYLRPAGRAVYENFHGEDMAGLTQVKMDHGESWDTLNSFGNTETIPPYSHDGQDYPLGRIIRGKGAGGYKGDPAMISMLEAQGQQPPVYVDTSWLLVAHIDETVSFVEADTPRGWALVVNDPTMTIELLQEARDAGHGDVSMFENKAWIDFNSGRPYAAEVSISEVLNGQNVMASTAEAAVEIEEQLDIIKAETGITESEIIRLPFLHMDVDGSSVAYSPGVVNGLSLTPTDFAAPITHGPEVDGVDIFEQATEDAFAQLGITVHWIEDWDMYHRLSGEVHCGTNTRRLVPSDVRWWESGR